MNYEQYGRSTASAQYFLQLAGYLGIPVIAWNADNSGLERVSSYGNDTSTSLSLSVSLSTTPTCFSELRRATCSYSWLLRWNIKRLRC